MAVPAEEVLSVDEAQREVSGLLCMLDSLAFAEAWEVTSPIEIWEPDASCYLALDFYFLAGCMRNWVGVSVGEAQNVPRDSRGY